MKMKYMRICILIAVVLISFGKARTQVVEVVDTKNITDQNVNGKSYEFLTSVSLQYPFYWSASAKGTFYCKPVAIQNQPPTISKNFVRIETILNTGITTENMISTLPVEGKTTVYNYVDGLGRALQEVTVQGSQSKQDIVKRHVYDGFGRTPQDYLPYTITSRQGGFRWNDQTEVSSFYTSTANVKPDAEPFSLVAYDDSPLNQVTKSYGVGKEWHPDATTSSPGHYVETKLFVNADNEVRQWVYNGPNVLPNVPNPPTLNGYVPAKLLTVIQTTDEQGQIRKLYKNFKGQNLLDRVWDGTYWLDTYTIYDWEGNVFCVMPPQASAKLSVDANYNTATLATQQTFLTTWCYLYDYDQYQRVRAKNIPGAGWSYMVYDPWDRLVMTWDGTLNGSNQQWIFTKYDQFNRPIMTGFYLASSSSTVVTVQNTVNSFYPTNSTNRYETRPATSTNSWGYTLNVTFPTQTDDSNLLTITYYDDYSFITGYTGWDAESKSYTYVSENGLPASNFATVKGYTTGSKVRLLDSSPTVWLNSVSYYDPKYRLIQTISENHLAGTDRVSDRYDFVKKLSTLRTHSSSLGSLSALEEYEYDHALRPTNTWQTLDPASGGVRTLVSSVSYNEKGEMIEKNLHSVNSAPFLQSMDYRYNIRGWLTSINNSALSNDGILNNDSNVGNDVFGMELMYNSPIAINGAAPTALWNGNISAYKWKSTNLNDAPKEKIFGFGYDLLNRITNSNYATNNAGTFNGDANAYNSLYTYRENGNLNTLKRWGVFGGANQLIDDLTYGYTNGNNSNQLDAVTDNALYQVGTPGQGFVESSKLTTGEYLYDPAGTGNVIGDVNRGIDITYNHLNRPKQVKIGPVNYIQYIYDASGAKLSEKVYKDINGTSTLITERHYIGGIHYEGGSISFVKTKEGRALKLGSSWFYEYHLTDHQGNVMAAIGSLKDATVYKAGMETFDLPTKNYEESTFKNIRSNNRSTVYNNTKATATIPLPTYSILTNGSVSGSEMGPGLKLATVNSGDHINMRIYARYTTPSSNATQDYITGSLLTMATTALGVSSGESAYTGFSNYYGGDASSVTANGTAPKAYLNYIVFNSTFTAQKFNFFSVSQAAASGFEKLELDFVIPAGFDGGSMYIWASNESNYPTYFDDFYVLQERANPTVQVTQLSDYYPFGLAFNTWNKESIKANRYTYQGQEYQDDLDYNEYQYGFRMHDPSLGRFMGIDPLAEKYMYNSPYAFSENKVINGVELEGLEYFYTSDGYSIGNVGSSTDVYSIDMQDGESFDYWRGIVSNAGGNCDDNGTQAAWSLLFSRATNLNISHDDFAFVSGIVNEEGKQGVADREEDRWLAHAINNESTYTGRSLRTTADRISSATVGNLPDINYDSHNSARSGLINVLRGAADPTGGARRWDGTDFLAWGLNSPDGTPHNKFEEFKHIQIHSSIYNQYLNANTSFWGNSVKYGGQSYSLPASVFTANSNWLQTPWNNQSIFFYNTGVTAGTKLFATGARGQSIFWAILTGY
jgi:RHS repeat-associated protein